MEKEEEKRKEGRKEEKDSNECLKASISKGVEESSECEEDGGEAWGTWWV